MQDWARGNGSWVRGRVGLGELGVSIAYPQPWNFSANRSGHQQSADTATWLTTCIFFGCVFLLHVHETACSFLNTAVREKLCGVLED